MHTPSWIPATPAAPSRAGNSLANTRCDASVDAVSSSHRDGNRIDEGEKLLLKAIEISPNFHPSYDYLIQLYQFKNDEGKVREWTEKKAKLSL